MPPSPPSDQSKRSVAVSGVPPDLVASALARIVSSAPFRRSPRHQQLLRHLVTSALAGNAGALKEALVAHEVFGRPIAAFDPARDTIVRVEARRLRRAFRLPE